ncbi:MAG: hypothetical protein ABMB14_10950, partial [Myxococcota bacterium]
PNASFGLIPSPSTTAVRSAASMSAAVNAGRAPSAEVAASVERLVLLAPAVDPAAYVAAVGSLGGPRVRAEAPEAMARAVGLHPRQVGVLATGAGLGLPVTVIHDRRDREIPFAAVEATVARWPGATLLPTHGLGHRRLLRDPAVVAAVVGAVGGADERSCGHGQLRGGCPTCALERELYHRPLRWSVSR